MKIAIAGLDMAFANVGVALGYFDSVTEAITVNEIHTIKTEPRAGKGVRMSSDELRRARWINDELTRLMATHQTSFIFGEVPSGSQSAKAARSLGIAVGILSCLKTPLIEVSPFEVKDRFVGDRQASKDKIIRHAASLYPSLPWKRIKSGFSGSNEHAADAIGAIIAGVGTPEFKQMLAAIRVASGKT